MSVFQLGPIIRNRREEMGLSQEDLADGICSVPTLSRIENGERMPTKSHYEMLMQRLGYSAMSLDFFTDKRDFQIHELKFKIRQAYIEQDINAVRTHLTELKCVLKEPTQIDQQFLMLYETLLNGSSARDAARLKRFEDALRLTCPRYDNSSFPHVLSYEEIILLNNMAICYHAQGAQDRAIATLLGIKAYYERHVISSDEALRTQTMILYNLSKVLGLVGRYDECIEVCDLGIRIARSTGRCPSLGKTLFNRAWALLQRDRVGDKEAAKVTLKQSYHFHEVMENRQEAEKVYKFYNQVFSGEDLL